jgi:hypothetical protein
MIKRFQRSLVCSSILIVVIIIYLIFSHKIKENITEIQRQFLKSLIECEKDKNNHQDTYLNDANIVMRDYLRYNCLNRKRIGGNEAHKKAANDLLWRIDGAWFICVDGNLAPVENNCNVLSFGILNDYTFDEHCANVFKCTVHSFDPFIEDKLFTQIRTKTNQPNAVSLKVNSKWWFHRIGIVGEVKETKSKNSIGWMATFDEILSYTQLNEKVIDVLKIDIEGYEGTIIKNINVNYFCKYVKQFVLETHPESLHYVYDYMRRIEMCFRLFHRDHRFFMGDKFVSTGHITEWQNPAGFKVNISLFKNELEFIKHLINSGELYFINKNFI